DKSIADDAAKAAGALGTINSSMSAFAQLTTASGADLMERLQPVVVCKFLSDFFLNATYRPVVDRIRDYPVLFRRGLVGMRDSLKDLLNQTDGATPLEWEQAAQELVEVQKVAMLEQGVPDASVAAELAAL